MAKYLTPTRRRRGRRLANNNNCAKNELSKEGKVTKLFPRRPSESQHLNVIRPKQINIHIGLVA